MKTKLRKILSLSTLPLVVGVALSLSVNFPAAATASTCNSSHCDLIAQYVNPAINVLSVSFGLIAVISLILGGIQFSASEGDPQKASAAKSRITNTVIAIVAYSLLYGFLQFLVPGGFF